MEVSANAEGEEVMPGIGYRPPPGAHLNALNQRMPMNQGVVGTGGMNQVRTPQGSPIGTGGFMGGSPGPQGRAPGFTGGSNNGSMGTMGAGWHPGLMDGPSQHMFNALPQGLEEHFGFAPQGFLDSLKRGGFKGGQSGQMAGGFGTGMF